MKYIMLVLLSVSAMAVEEISQTVTTRINTPLTFELFGPNEGRGISASPASLPSIWKFRYSWFDDGVMASRTLIRLSSPDGAVLTVSPFPIGTGPILDAFNAWQGQQEKSLHIQSLRAIRESEPQTGTLSVPTGVFSPAFPNEYSGPRFVYVPAQSFVGIESAVFCYKDSSLNEYTRVRLTINVINDAPTISLSASPSIALVGSEIALPAATTDANGHAVSVSYDYGDGSTGSADTHTYSAPGVYTITATASDGFGGTAAAQASVTIVGNENTPTARFTTSDVVAFVGVPFVLDGITSTDPQNAIESYTWDFGDGTPLGTKPTLSHIYQRIGLTTIRFTVTDSEGLSSTLTRDIEVLSEEAAATFDAEVRVTSTFYPLKQNKDIIQVFARMNIGDTTLGAGSTVALEYGGKRFAATLDGKGKGSGFLVKQNLRRQAPGTVEITFKARNTAVAESLTLAGAIDGGTVDVPFRLELGPKTILVDVPTDFEVGAARGKGSGELE